MKFSETKKGEGAIYMIHGDPSLLCTIDKQGVCYDLADESFHRIDCGDDVFEEVVIIPKKEYLELKRVKQ